MRLSVDEVDMPVRKGKPIDLIDRASIADGFRSFGLLVCVVTVVDIVCCQRGCAEIQCFIRSLAHSTGRLSVLPS